MQEITLPPANSISKMRPVSLIALSLLAVILPASAIAQEAKISKPEQPAASAVAPKVINIWPGVAPGSEQWKQREAHARFRPHAADRRT